MKKTNNQMKQMIYSLDLDKIDLYNLLETILTPTQFKVYINRFDSEGNIVKSMTEISKIMNCTKQNINLILNKIYTIIEQEVKKREPNFKIKPNKNKADQIIETIKETHKLPIYYKKFDDGTYQRSYYDSLKANYKKIKENDESDTALTEKEKSIIKEYEKINRALEKSQEIMVLSYKAEELIKTIKKLHRLPQTRNKSNPEATFNNGTDQRNYYNYISFSKNAILEKKKQGIPLTKAEKQTLFDYNEIFKVLKKYQKIPIRNSKCPTKKEEFIKTIHKNHRLPKRADYNNGVVDEFFSNGDIQRVYYENLRYKAIHYIQLQNEGHILNDKELQIIQDYTEIDNVLSFYPYKYNKFLSLIIKTCQSLKIDINENKGLKGKSFYEIYIKIAFMIENNIPVTIDGKINPIVFMSDANMQEKYNVSIEELVEKYINGSINCETVFKVLEKK